VLARLHGTEVYVVHMSCREAVEALQRARAAGERCYGETCPQYLLLDDTVFARPDFEAAAYVCSPPLRPAGRGTRSAVGGLAAGVLDTVGTDHCPFTMEQKRLGRDDFTRIPAACRDRGPPPVALHLRCVRGALRPAAHGGGRQHEPGPHLRLYPRKGEIAVGSDADLVLYDPAPTSVRSAQPTTRSATATLRGLRREGSPEPRRRERAHLLRGRQARCRAGRRALPGANPRVTPGSLPAGVAEMGRIG